MNYLYESLILHSGYLCSVFSAPAMYSLRSTITKLLICRGSKFITQENVKYCNNLTDTMHCASEFYKKFPNIEVTFTSKHSILCNAKDLLKTVGIFIILSFVNKLQNMCKNFTGTELNRNKMITIKG